MKAWPPRLSWGVTLSSTGLLGDAWDKTTQYRATAPPRPLLFRSRTHARQWCEAQHAKYRARTDSLKDWRFRPVRVRESWEIVT